MTIFRRAHTCCVTVVALVLQGVAGATMADNEWEVVLEWGEFGSGPGQFDLPFDVALDSAGYVYVSDNHNDRIQVFDGAGGYVREWSVPSPTGIGVDENDEVFVVITPSCRVVRFTNVGQRLDGWGQCQGEGNLQGVSDVAVNAGVAFATANSLQKHSVDGDYLGAVETGVAWYRATIPADGTLWLLGGFPALVGQFSPDGTSLREWNPLPPHEPVRDFHGIAVTADEVITTELVDLGVSSISCFTHDGDRTSRTLLGSINLGSASISGSDTLYAVAFDNKVVKLSRRVDPVETTTWGRIKAAYADESSEKE